MTDPVQQNGPNREEIKREGVPAPVRPAESPAQEPHKASQISSRFQAGDFIRATGFSADESRAFSISNDGHFCMHDPVSLRPVSQIRIGTHFTTSVISGDASYVISGLHGETVRFREINLRDARLDFRGNTSRHGGIWAADVSRGGDLVALGLKNRIEVLNGKDLTVRASFRGYYSSFPLTMSIVKFTPDGQNLLCGGPRGHLWLLDFNDCRASFLGRELFCRGKTARVLAQTREEMCVDSAAFSRDVKLLAISVSGGNVKVFSFENFRRGLFHPLFEQRFGRSYIRDLQFDESGGRLLIAGDVQEGEGWRGFMKILDVSSPRFREIFSLTNDSGSFTARFNGAANRVIAGDMNGIVRSFPVTA